MPWLLVGVAVLLAALLFARWLVNANPARLSRLLVGSAIVGAVGLALLVVLRAPGLVITAAPFLAMLVLWWLRRRRRGTRLGGGWSTPGAGGPADESVAESAWLRMTLDHGSGRIDGTVLQGPSAGRRLDDLPDDDLRVLRRACGGDPDSARLLESYLDRRWGADWRAREAASGAEDPSGEPLRPAADARSPAEALSVLGLGDGATHEEIRAAHRRLMRAVHPDHGGSDELAARVNRARQVLLGE